MKNDFNQNELDMFSRGGKPVDNLSRFTALCGALGNPEDGLKFIHIAGTNGKGSVSEYISHALVSAGYKTGKFTSPYIFNIRERIQLQNKPIAEKDFAFFIKTSTDAAMKTEYKQDYSQFEILTAAAFLYYRKKNAQIVVLETGIGGLLDCTNVVKPEISIITAIDYDHSNILGGSLSEIARHKAGIIKTAPSVMYPIQERAVYLEVRKRCEQTGSELTVPVLDLLKNERTTLFGNSFVYKEQEFSTEMGGRHQVLNALTAIEALKIFGVENEFIKIGLKNATLPSRLQIIRKNPLVILDGAHNTQGISAARSALSDWRVKRTVVLGMVAGKDYIGALKEFMPFADKIVFTDGFDENAVSCSDLYLAAVMLGCARENIYTVSEPRRAVELAEELCGGGIVLVTGSLRLAGSLGGI